MAHEAGYWCSVIVGVVVESGREGGRRGSGVERKREEAASRGVVVVGEKEGWASKLIHKQWSMG